MCVPYRPSAPWYYKLAKLASDKHKIRAGKLVRVDAAAPNRLEEWPAMLFLVRKPREKSKSAGKKRAVSRDGAPAAAPAAVAAVPELLLPLAGRSAEQRRASKD